METNINDRKDKEVIYLGLLILTLPNTNIYECQLTLTLTNVGKTN